MDECEDDLKPCVGGYARRIPPNNMEVPQALPVKPIRMTEVMEIGSNRLGEEILRGFLNIFEFPPYSLPSGLHLRPSSNIHSP
jgi:hypothetical protein